MYTHIYIYIYVFNIITSRVYVSGSKATATGNLSPDPADDALVQALSATSMELMARIRGAGLKPKCHGQGPWLERNLPYQFWGFHQRETPIAGWFSWKSQLKVDDDWGYLYDSGNMISGKQYWLDGRAEGVEAIRKT